MVGRMTDCGREFGLFGVMRVRGGRARCIWLLAVVRRIMAWRIGTLFLVHLQSPLPLTFTFTFTRYRSPAYIHRYSYDSCDVGTLANQTWPNGTAPAAALNTGAEGTPLSFLPGQRYSACTCPGEDHPGPRNDVGRAAPEIDLIEAQIILDLQVGEVSQSFQVAPYDDYYQFNNASIYCDVADFSVSRFNSYKGGVYQQAVSVLTQTPRRIYQTQQAQAGPRSAEFGVFELEWFADFNNRRNGHITWSVDGKRAWTMYPDAVAPNPRSQVGRRIIAEEPMYMIFNFAMVSWLSFFSSFIPHPLDPAFPS